jgi:iron complex transport system substrate-binding protein
MKIVSLLPSATELAGELGIEDMLCAISHECDTPSSVMGLPRITGSNIPHGLSQKEINDCVAEMVSAGRSLYTVDGVLLDAIGPDLVLTQGLCDVCAVSPNTIEASLRGVQCRLSSDTQIISFNGASLDGIREDLFTLAEAVERVESAERIWTGYKARWDALTKGHASKRVLLLEWIDPAYSPGHWVPEQIEAAGLVSAYGTPGDHSRPMHMDDIREARPDAVGVICCGFGLDDNIRFARQMAIRLTDELGFTGEVAAFDANRCFSRPTLSVVDGAEVLHQTFVRGEAVVGKSAFITSMG